jgi:hypothetical protein
MSTINKSPDNATSGSNPLSKYFRVPGLHVHLPTSGAFFSEGTIEFLADNSLAVLPMRAADELLLKNPDALMSGYAIEKLIESCVPGVKNPREISAPDLDVLLLAIRAATYGDQMEIQATCPKCQHVNTFDCDLPNIIQNTTPVPADNAVRLTDDIVVYVRPYNLDNTTSLSMATFSETRKVQALDFTENVTHEQRTAQMNSSMDELAKLAARLVAQCIVRIVTPEGEVTESSHIQEFFGNISRSWTNKIEEKLNELNSAGIDKTLKVKCERATCGNEWTTTVEFDPSSFFDSGSSD